MACGCNKAKKENAVKENKDTPKDARDSAIPLISANSVSVRKLEELFGSLSQLAYEYRCGYPHLPHIKATAENLAKLAGKDSAISVLLPIMIADLEKGTQVNFEILSAELEKLSETQHGRGTVHRELRMRTAAASEEKSRRILVKTRPSCLRCVEKHVGSAYALASSPAYADYLMAVGHLAQAEQEAKDYPELEDAIYATRSALQDRRTTSTVVPVEFTEMLVRLNAVVTADEADQQISLVEPSQTSEKTAQPEPIV